MNNKTLLQNLENIGACHEAREWAAKHGGTLAELWADCDRGDWMAWWIAKNPPSNKTKFYLALADCASLALKHFEDKHPDDKRPKKAIETLRLYAQGKASLEQLRDAADAAYAAAAAADDYAAYAAATATAYAATAAAYAADAADAYAAYAAASATDYAATAAAGGAIAADYIAYASAAAADARAKTLKKCADVFRKYFSVENAG